MHSRTASMTLLVMLTLPTFARAEVMSLEGNQYRITVETAADQFREITFTNTANGDLIRSNNLFDIKGMDDRLTSSADFRVTAFAKVQDHINIELKNADFVVKSAIRLPSNKSYASIDFSLGTRQNDLRINGFSMLPFCTQAPFVYGAINSSPIISDSFFITPQNPLVNTRAYEGGVSQLVSLKLPLSQDKPLSYRTYIGTFGEGQLRRDFNRFINDARDRPYAPYLHYNSWLDIGFFTPYTEAEALKRINQIGEALVKQRGVPVNGFLFDDGWDNRKGNWAFSKDFPDGFHKLKKAAEKYHAQLGIWLSPWGGYNKPRDERISHAAEFGYELSDGKFALSGPIYYQNFHQKVMSLIKEQGVTHFKFDGTGNADKLIKGSRFTSDFDAAINLIADARATNKDVFINLTTGTTASPAWLFFADSIWRGGDDINFYGPGSKVQQWITYRDAETYRSIVKNGPLFPLNSLMLHGLVYAKQAKHLDKQSPQDFADQAWSYFATGTQLQELYLTPELLTGENWDLLARAALWSRQNQDTLFDSHWIGGDPTLQEVYGWAAWSPDRAFITLRNPSSQPQQFLLEPQRQLEIPSGEASYFEVRSRYGNNPTVPSSLGNGAVIKLAPLELITLELTPSIELAPAS
ncbi:enterotoxin [Aeromonas sp. S9(2024)]|uniref:enterotoxin n=1 Tax=Aeromonas sp. S9(2024) TaxID=3242882 RepID=UPI0035281417